MLYRTRAPTLFHPHLMEWARPITHLRHPGTTGLSARWVIPRSKEGGMEKNHVGVDLREPSSQLHLLRAPPESLKIVQPASSESMARGGHRQRVLAPSGRATCGQNSSIWPCRYHEDAPRSHSSSSQHFEAPRSKFSRIPGSTFSLSSSTKLIRSCSFIAQIRRASGPSA